MAAPRYRPLDLSFLATQYSPRREDIRNTAQMILANAGWSNPSQVTVKEIAAAKKKQEEAMKHKVSPISGFFDLLSAPLYGLANALDEAIAGHQSDSNDSVIEDIGKTVGGFFTGATKGVGAGLRGGTALLDVLPGVDINDDWQGDPTDKTHFSDVGVRWATGMPTSEAIKPENWEKVKTKLEGLNDKPWYLKGLTQFIVPDDLEASDAREKYFKKNALAGIGSDILGDPLNLMFLGGKSAVTAPKAIDEGLEAARSANSTDTILNALKSNAPKDAWFKEKTSPPVAPIEEVINPGAAIPVKSIGSLFPKGGVKTIQGIGGREIPKAGVEIPIKDQQVMAAKITRLAAANEPNWQYKAMDILRSGRNADSINFAGTESLIQRASEMSKAGKRHNPKALYEALKGRISEDVAKVRPVEPAERILNTSTDVVIKPGAPRLKRPEAELANRVARKFQGQILGTARAPGTGEGLERAIASGHNVRYSGPQQARMWNQITSSLKYSNPKKFDKAVRILRAVEDSFIAKGAIPHSAAKTSESVPLRLSQVAEAIGPQILGQSRALITGILRGDEKALAQLSPEARQGIEQLKASESIVTAPAVQSGIEFGKEMADHFTLGPRSVGRIKNDLDRLPKIVRLETAKLGGGDVGARVAGEYIGNLIGKSDIVNKAISMNRLKTEAWLAKDAISGAKVNDADFVKSITSAISKSAELPPPASLGKIAGSATFVKEWFGARFNAAYGVQDMRPIFLREQASALSTVARRARLINELGKRFDPKDVDLWHEAMRTAQMNGISDGRVAELQAEIAKVMENLFGGTGLRSGAIADSTVVGRNRLFLDELNTSLRRFGLGEFKFTNKAKVKDAAGNVRDFSKGADWLKSWEVWNIKKPYDFLHAVQNAVEHVVRQKNMFDEIATRFGSTSKLGPVKYTVNHPRLRGFYFNEEGARQANQFIKILNEVNTPNGKSLQYIDHVISKLKASLTIYIPGHHMTNLIGDVMYNWMAGVNKPSRYTQAIKVMQSQKGRYGDFASFNKLTGPNALKQAIARSVVKPDAGLAIPAAGNKVIVTMRSGVKVTADMIMTAAMKEGILPSARVLEEVTSDVSSVLDKFRPLGGRGQSAVHTVSEIRDHIPRLAQFIDGIAKGSGSFSQIVEKSAAAVRKWHPDGLDLTKFERNVMKRVFPFYSWTRKAIPLAIEASIAAGPKVMAYPRLMEALAISNGVDAEGNTTQPFPTDQMFPDWLRARGIGPIAGGPGNYLVVNPSTPVLDMMTMMGQPGAGALDMLNPLAKVPIEIAGGQTLGRNVPIDNYSDYFAKQIPVISQLGRASGQFGVSQSTKDEGFPNYINIINMLTGLKATDTGKYQKSGQFDVKDYLKKKSQQQGR